jgi:exodeoxyribonuclease VII small subunit
MAKTTKSIEALTYEQALQELEGILEELESESRGLDETMGLFERGQLLIQHCQTLLDKAELKVRTLGQENQTEDGEE